MPMLPTMPAIYLVGSAQVLVMRIFLPYFGFAGPTDYHRFANCPCFSRNGGREVHHRSDSAEHSLRVVHEVDQVPNPCSTTQIYRPIEFRMVISPMAHLHELDASPEVIDHILIPLVRP